MQVVIPNLHRDQFADLKLHAAALEVTFGIDPDKTKEFIDEYGGRIQFVRQLIKSNRISDYP